MDSVQNKPVCWEIIGCGRQNECRVLKLAESTGKPCWEVVAAFDDYRTAMNVCEDCIVSVLNQHQLLSMTEIDDIMSRKGGKGSHQPCPGLTIT